MLPENVNPGCARRVSRHACTRSRRRAHARTRNVRIHPAPNRTKGFSSTFSSNVYSQRVFLRAMKGGRRVIDKTNQNSNRPAARLSQTEESDELMHGGHRRRSPNSSTRHSANLLRHLPSFSCKSGAPISGCCVP